MRPHGGRRARPRVTAKHLSTFAIAGLLGAWALVAPTISDASAPSTSRALIESVSATPSTLSASGGIVTVTGTISHATSCQLGLLSHQSFPVVYSNSPKSCSSGNFSARITIGANPSSISRNVAFDLVARNASSSFTAGFYVALEAPMAPTVISVSGSPSAERCDHPPTGFGHVAN